MWIDFDLNFLPDSGSISNCTKHMQINLTKVYYCTVFTVPINTYNVIQSLNFITNTKSVQIQRPTCRSLGNYTKVFIQQVKS